MMLVREKPGVQVNTVEKVVRARSGFKNRCAEKC